MNYSQCISKLTTNFEIQSSQFGIFNSHMRYHGNPPRYREPWNYEINTTQLVRELLNLRYRMLPYIYSEAQYCSETGLPMLRALVLEYQNDPNVYRIEDQYLFGRNLLIAPILTEEDERKIYFPEGEWVDFWSFKRYPSRTWVDYICSLDKIPVFLKVGTILPLGPLTQYISDQAVNSLSLLVIPDSHNHIDPYEFVDGKKMIIGAQITNCRLCITFAEPFPLIQIKVEIPEQYGIEEIEINGKNLPIEIPTNGMLTGKYNSQ